MANLVAIVGRPNVGKSTLFNRLTQSRRAIVSDTAGTTRDRQYGKCQWNGREFSVVDTGGWVVKSDDIFEDAIRRQVLVATEEADLVLFVVDNETGVTDWDEDVAQILRRTKLPVILVANKVDNSGEYYMSADFYRLGLGDPVCISAQTGSGTGDLLDLILKRMPDAPDEGIDDEIPRFAVVGRPNAGKSSLINAFIGEDRNIVTDIAGTTRDSIYTRYNKFGFDFYLVDTAGIRRKNKVTEDLEFYSVMRLDIAKQVYINRNTRIGTTKLNEVLLPIIEETPPPSVKGKYIKIKYCSQLPNTQIPSFVFYANLPQYVKEAYRRFLENKIREHWNLNGCPINVFIRQK